MHWREGTVWVCENLSVVVGILGLTSGLGCPSGMEGFFFVRVGDVGDVNTIVQGVFFVKHYTPIILFAVIPRHSLLSASLYQNVPCISKTLNHQTHSIPTQPIPHPHSSIELKYRRR